MNYREEILRILAEAGTDGLSVHKLSVHVHNACNSLFETVEYSKVRAEVSKFLIRNSRKDTSPIEHMKARGMYRLKPDSCSAMQLMLQFKDEESQEECQESRVEQDFSLSLF